MANVIYFIVAILMFISSVQYLENDKSGKWNKRFHLIMQVIFFISNIICLVLSKESVYWQSFVCKTTNGTNIIVSVAYILFGIPIFIYVIMFICYILKKHFHALDVFVVVLWFIYFVFFCIGVFGTHPFESKKIMYEHKNVLEYKEEVIKGAFSYSIDYTVKIQDLDTGEEIKVIKTRLANDDISVKVYPHQQSSYIEEWHTIERSITFFGNIYEEQIYPIVYKIYLSDDIYYRK